MAIATQLGIQVHLDTPYEDALERVTAALKTQGFGVLTSIDIKTTLKNRLDVDFRKYAILGACNPPLAHRALSNELAVGLLLPCNVIVYEDTERGGTSVMIGDPIAMIGLIDDNPTLAEVAQDARNRLEKVAAALTA
ncbi:MAG TPA: ABC transporter ATP-binding protein [Chloroflexi bacterium]|nr:ABC transporter ATP-binding protein [Chloroflexota bacterium]HHW87369.1 DUF302 domain-containing protein [Chloroflexota bacterium]